MTVATDPAPHSDGDPVAFLRTLWPDDDTPGYLVLWWRENKHCEFVPVHAIETVVPRLLEQRGNVNVYFGMGLQSRSLSHTQRGTEATVCAVPGLWADLDTDAGHMGTGTRKTYPPTKQDVLTLLAEGQPAPPTFVVDSGNGIHAYWLAREPWTLENQAERIRAKLAVRGLEVRLRSVAITKGWTTDSVHDIARVMRIPGTINRKEGLPDQPCRILSASESVYNPSDFDGWVPEGVTARPELQQELVGGDFTIKCDANVPEAVHVLCRDTTDPRFDRSWKRTRTDITDTSASGWEASLCTLMVSAIPGIDNQTLMDMCASMRRLNNDSKTPRQKGLHYYENLFRFARNHRGQRDTQAIRELAQEQAATDEEERIEEVRETGTQLDHLRRELPLPGLERIIKRGKEGARYFLVMRDGTEIAMGAVDEFRAWPKFQNKLADALKRMIGPSRRPADRGPGAWHPLVSMMIEVSEEQDIGEEGDSHGVLMTRLEEYARIKLPKVTDEEPDQKKHAVHRAAPYVGDQRLHVNGTDFMGWLEAKEKRRRDPSDVRAFLRRALGPSAKESARPYRGSASGRPANNSYFQGPVPSDWGWLWEG